jgi:hypothetical protein
MRPSHLLIALAITASAFAPLRAVQELPPIAVEAEAFKAGADDILAICRSAAGELVRHFPESHDFESVRIRQGDTGPLVAYRRTDEGEVLVLLNTGGTLWAQYAYQFAHEFCHILCHFHPDNPHLWFEEILCETASLFALRAMARAWKDNPPYPNWRDYRDSLRSYADEVIASRQLVATLHRDGLAAFYQARQQELPLDPTDRETNGAIAAILLPLFERDPASWEALRFMRSTPPAADFPSHLDQWHDRVPERHRAFVASIISLFGLPEPAVK